MVSRRMGRASGLGVLAATMSMAMMASTAFACTIYKGRIDVIATGPGAAGSATAQGYGPDTAQHRYCGTPQRGNLVTSGPIRVDVAPSTACPTNGQLTNGTYTVFWVAAAPTETLGGPTTTGNVLVDGVTDPNFFNCNSTALQNSQKKALGTMTVTNGTGTAPVTLAGNATPGPGNICVTPPDGGSTESPSSPQVYINWI